MSGYDFSPFYHCSNVAFSPGSTFLATSHSTRIVVRSTSNLSIIRTWDISPSSPSSINLKGSTSKIIPSVVVVDQLEWSDDGLYLFAFSKSTGSVWVFGLAEEGNGEHGEIAKIAGGSIDGIQRVEWVKGGRELITLSEHSLRLMIYSLPDRSTSMIMNPKKAEGCHAYSPDQRYFALVERHAGKDVMATYDIKDSFRLVRNFPLSTNDVSSISWSPCGKYIAAIDSYLSYSIYIHSPIGPILAHLSPSCTTFNPLPSGSSRQQNTTSNSKPGAAATGAEGGHEDPGLGIKDVAWSLGGKYLAVSDWNGKVRIWESGSWICLAVLSGFGSKKGTTLWREPEGWIKDTRGRGIVQFDRVNSISFANTTSISPTTAPFSLLALSPTSKYLSFTSPLQPSILHIYSLSPSLQSSIGELDGSAHINQIASISFNQAIRSASWAGGHGKSEKVAILTGKGAVYVWSDEEWVDDSEVIDEVTPRTGNGGMMEGVGIPNGANFLPFDIMFSPDHSALSIRSKSEFCIMYEPESTEQAQQGNHVGWETEGLSLVEEGEEEEDEEIITKAPKAPSRSLGPPQRRQGGHKWDRPSEISVR